MKIRSVLALLAALAPAALAQSSAPAQSAPAQSDQPVAYVNATLMPVSRGNAPAPAIERGTMVVQGSKILAVGDASTAIPAGATRVDLAGKVIIPGLVDTHNHIGGIGGADQSGPIQPDVSVRDSVNVLDSGFKRALSGGLTTLNIMPGSGHLLSGQTIYVKLRGGRTIDDLLIRDADGKQMGGLKMANGTNSLSGQGGFPGTRGKSAALVRERFVAAQEYARKVKAAGDDASKLPPRDLGLEVLGEVLSGKRIVHHHTHRADDVITVLRLQKEFGFRVVLHHVSEAWKVADELAKSDGGWGKTFATDKNPSGGVPCSIILVDSPGGKLEAQDLIHETGGVLEKAGVPTCYHTDDWITDVRLFLRMAALGVRGGMSRDGALAALTIQPAKMLDLGDRVGSLEAGKDADFVVLSGDPFSVYTKVEQTFVEGRKVFDRADPADRLFATGGFGAGRDQNPYFCCYGQFGQGGGAQ
jgi:imidazolonepropionase-like amidohydrolase